VVSQNPYNQPQKTPPQQSLNMFFPEVLVGFIAGSGWRGTGDGSSKISKWLAMDLEVGLRSGTDLGTSRWLVMELEVGLRIGADLWTSRCIV
jgi:hypothetical protein